MRRPLAVCCLLFVIAVFLRVNLALPEAAGWEEAEGKMVCLAGKVYQKEIRPNRSGEDQMLLYLNHIAVSGEYESILNREMIQGVLCYLEEVTEVPLGSTVLVQGKVQPFAQATNPGEFDSREYYRILKLDFRLKNAEIKKISKDYNKLQELLYSVKEKCGNIIDTFYDRTDAGIMKTVLLGDKTDLEDPVEEQYKRNGIIHVMAISGLHISLLGMGVCELLKKCRIPAGAAGGMAMAFIGCFGIMTGMKASACRAMLMFAIKITADIIGRNYDLVTALALAAVFLLLEQPLYVKHTGFLLSFGAVLGIGLVLPQLQKKQKEAETDWKRRKERQMVKSKRWKMKHRKKRKISARAAAVFREAAAGAAKGLLPGISIFLITFPIQISAYYQYPIYSILLNLLVVPLMTLVMISGLLVIMAGAVQLPVLSILCGKGAAALGHGILEVYSLACGLTERLPGAVIVTGKPEAGRIAVYYGLLLVWILLTYEKEEKERNNICFLKTAVRFGVIGIALFVLLVRFSSGVEITFLDVGQGDCIYVRSGSGNSYLFDGGSTSKTKVGEYQIVPFLKSRGVGCLEAVFVSHGDKDHYSGIEELLENEEADRVRIRRLVLPAAENAAGCEHLALLAQEQGIAVCYVREGDKITDDILTFTCLNPEGRQEKGSSEGGRLEILEETAKDVNEQSQVFYLTYLDFSALLTGDVTGESEREMYERLEEVSGGKPLTVLKVAHHGSRYSTEEVFLNNVRPVFSVISCGKKNSYGHPHEELLERLKECGTTVFKTTESGAVTIWTNGKKVKIKEHMLLK